MDVITYGILKKKIQSAGTGISDITKENGYLVFTMADGSEIRVEDATKDVIGIDVDVERYIVVTYEDGSTTKSDHPIPNTPLMAGATEDKDGTSGSIPAPTKGGIRYFNSQGDWDDTPTVEIENIKDDIHSINDNMDSLNDAVPTDTIPDGSTLTSDGWAVATEKEIADEFAQWEV